MTKTTYSQGLFGSYIIDFTGKIADNKKVRDFIQNQFVINIPTHAGVATPLL